MKAHMSIINLGLGPDSLWAFIVHIISWIFQVFFYCLKLCLELLFNQLTKIIRKEEKECFDFEIKENFLLFLFLACFHLQLVKLVSEILNVRFVGFFPFCSSR